MSVCWVSLCWESLCWVMGVLWLCWKSLLWDSIWWVSQCWLWYWVSLYCVSHFYCYPKCRYAERHSVECQSIQPAAFKLNLIKKRERKNFFEKKWKILKLFFSDSRLVFFSLPILKLLIKILDECCKNSFL